jgi:hypothetical protein
LYFSSHNCEGLIRGSRSNRLENTGFCAQKTIFCDQKPISERHYQIRKQYNLVRATLGIASVVGFASKASGTIEDSGVSNTPVSPVILRRLKRGGDSIKCIISTGYRIDAIQYLSYLNLFDNKANNNDEGDIFRSTEPLKPFTNEKTRLSPPSAITTASKESCEEKMTSSRDQEAFLRTDDTLEQCDLSPPQFSQSQILTGVEPVNASPDSITRDAFEVVKVFDRNRISSEVTSSTTARTTEVPLPLSSHNDKGLRIAKASAMLPSSLSASVAVGPG